MKLTKRDKIKKYAVYFAFILAAALLQNVQNAWFSIGGARCFFLIPVAVLLGIDEDERTAAMLGLLSGIIWDTVSAQHMGFNAVFLMIVCYISSSLVTYLFRATYWVGVVSCAVSTLFYILTYWLLFVMAKGGDGAADSIWYFYIPCFIYTSVISLLLNPAIIAVKRRMNREPCQD